MTRRTNLPTLTMRVLLLLCALSSVSGGEVPKNLTLSFHRVTVKEGQEETLTATAYIRSSPHLFCIEATEPIKQLVFFSPKNTLIYYPDEKKAMRIDYETQQDISLETELTYLFRKDKGLELSGYRLDHIESTNELTVSIWLPPAPFAKKIRDVRVVTDGSDRVLSMTTTGTGGKTMQETVYSGYEKGFLSLPTEVRTRMFLTDGSVQIETKLTLFSGNSSPALPERISAFVVPSETPLEILKW